MIFRFSTLIAALAIVGSGCTLANETVESVEVETVEVELRANSAEDYCDSLAAVLEGQAELATFGPDQDDAKVEALERFGAALLDAADDAPVSQAEILDGYAVANVRLIAAERTGSGLAEAKGDVNQYFFSDMQPVYAHADQSCEIADLAMPSADDAPGDDTAAPGANGADDAEDAGLVRAPGLLIIPDPAAELGTFGCSITEDFRYVIDMTNDAEEISDFQLEAVVFDADGEQLNTTEMIIKALRPGERTVEARPGAPAAGATCEEVSIERFGLAETSVASDVVGCVLTPAGLETVSQATSTFLNTTNVDRSYLYTIAFIGDDGIRRGAAVGTTGLIRADREIEGMLDGPGFGARAITCEIVEAFRVTPG